MKLIYKAKKFAQYGNGPHHCSVCIKGPDGSWKCHIEDGDYQTVKELYKTTERSDQTIKVTKLD